MALKTQRALKSGRPTARRLITAPLRIAYAADRIVPIPIGPIVRMRGGNWMRVIERIKQRDCGICQKCKTIRRYAIGSEVDHKRPLSEGGSDDDSNLWLLCVECHKAKTQAEAKHRGG